MSIKIDKQLNWRDHINEAAIKLNRDNAMLFKKGEYVSAETSETLRYILYVIFDLHLNYGNLV